MTNEEKHKIAYDLSMEYIKRGNSFNKSKDEIPKIVNEFSEIYEKFSASIDNSKLNNII